MLTRNQLSSWLVIQVIEGSLEVKLLTRWTDGKAEVGRVREEKRRREKVREEKESEVQVRDKVEKSRNTVFSNDLWLQMIEKWAR